MERELIKSLIKWKASQSRKPLILKGVRQCGKTYLLKEFGARCYQDTAYFNFEENEALKTVFEKDYDIKRIIFELELQHGKKIQTENTLIIFDEIQECGRALTSLKYFCENAPEYHIVCAGSLLGIALRKQLSFPVGKVDFMTLYPMSYVEFLRAYGSRQLRRKIPHLSDRVRSEIQRTREEYQFCKNLNKRKKQNGRNRMGVQ